MSTSEQTDSSTSTTAWAYRPELDGVRTIAVYLVLLFHAKLPQVSGGFIGVDLFFVLSGFLVSNVILAEFDRRGTFSLGTFYSRRVRRLLPAAVLVIVATCLLQVLAVTAPVRLEMVDDARASLLYFANWQFIIDAKDYFGDTSLKSPFLHFWSLSIEEQFYIGFPLVLLLLIKLKVPQRVMIALLAAVAALSIFFQIHAASTDTNYAYYATHTRVYQLLAGVILAMVLREVGKRRDLDKLDQQKQLDHHKRLAPVAAIVGVAGLFLLASSALDLSQSHRGLLAAAASVLAIGGLFQAPRFVLSKALALPIPRYLGQISYGTYLWHWPALLVLDQVTTVAPWQLAVLGAGISTALAALSFQIFETPIRRSPRLSKVTWLNVATGLAISALVAFTVVSPILHDSNKPALGATSDNIGTANTSIAELAAMDKKIPGNIDFEALLNERRQYGTACAEGTPQSCVLVDNPGAPEVVLVGDSHAAQISPTLAKLAKEKGFTYASAVMNSCPWQHGLLNKNRPEIQSACIDLRDRFYDSILPKMKPDLVIVSSKARSGPGWDHSVTTDDAAEHPDETRDQAMLRKTQATVEAIRATGAKVLIVHSMFGTRNYQLGGPNPLDCLAGAKLLSECAVAPPTFTTPADSFYTYLATALDGVATVDFRPVYCPNTVLCSPIIDGDVVWVDENHLVPSFLVDRREALWKLMQGSGVFPELSN